MDGESLARTLKTDIATYVSTLKKKGIMPTLATILVGEEASSKTYVRLKERDCQEVGIRFNTFKLSAKTSEREIIELINELNKNDEIHGILVQLPLPPPLNETRVVGRIAPKKDVDGLHPLNVGKLWLGTYDFDSNLLPCTPKGIVKLLDRYNIELAGKNVVIINRSNSVGKPLSKLILDRNATINMCHSKTLNLEMHTRAADILIVAVGRRPQFLITEDMVKEGGIIVDVGINYAEGKLCGDVDFEKVKEKASYVSPVPGGVGPMTRVMLLHNILIAAKDMKGNL